MIKDTGNGLKDNSAVDPFRRCNTALHRAGMEWPSWSQEWQSHQHRALQGRLPCAGIPHIYQGPRFCGSSQLTLHNTASDTISLQKKTAVTYQLGFTGNQQHFSTWALRNSCFFQKSAVSSHHYHCFVLHQPRRNFRRIAEYHRSQVFQRPESLQRKGARSK